MYRMDEIPEAYHCFCFVNAGGPGRAIRSREKVQKKWQLVTLECGHQLLLPGYHKAAKVGCGFCGGFAPVSESSK